MSRLPVVGGDLGGWGSILNDYLSQSLDASGGVTVTGSTTSRTLPTRFAEIINVKDYGAKGDGVTDDRAAIVLALGVATTGTVIFFPPTSTYYRVINPNVAGNTITPNAGTYLWGYGATIQIEGSASAGGEVLRIQNDDVTIEGLTITLSAAFAATNGFSGIGVARRLADNVIPKRARIVNTKIVGFKTVGGSGGVGINSEVGVTGLYIAGNYITNCDNGIWVGTSTTYPETDITIIGNVITTTTNSAGGTAFTLTGNAIMVTHNTAVDAIAPSVDNVNAVITGNVIDNAPVALHVSGTGHVTFAGNTAKTIGTYGVFIEESQFVIVSQNIIAGALTNYVRIRQISGAVGNQQQEIFQNVFAGSASGNGIDADGSFSRSLVAFNKMQAVSGTRLSLGTAVNNVTIDVDETALTGFTQFVNGILLSNGSALNINNTGGTAIPVIALDGSNNVNFQRGGGVQVGSILNATGTLQYTGGPLQVVTGGGGIFGSPTGGDKGSGTVNAAGAYYANGSSGVTKVNVSSTFTNMVITNGIITSITT